MKLREVLDACTERVESKSNTSENCTEELFDFIHCVDHCVRYMNTQLAPPPNFASLLVIFK